MVFYFRKKGGQQETGVRKLWAGRGPVQGKAPAGAGLGAQAFLAVGFGEALSPPKPVSSMGGQEISSPLCWAEEQSKQRHLGERILNGPHLLPLSKQRAPCDRLHKAHTIWPVAPDTLAPCWRFLEGWTLFTQWPHLPASTPFTGVSPVDVG